MIFRVNRKTRGGNDAAAAGEGSAPLLPKRRNPGRIALALQGGGALGAFTWGVLDRLLEAEDLAIDAVSGASAGAINAAVMASGLP